uniref:Dynein_C domain-containing protein n=1 Tax=Mesocestoides corti TaxID=53468 RepID=A0A5K3G1X8_MESCO
MPALFLDDIETIEANLPVCFIGPTHFVWSTRWLVHFANLLIAVIPRAVEGQVAR